MRELTVDEYFVQSLRRAATETRRICLRGNQKLTLLEDRIRRVGHFSTCLRRHLGLKKPSVLDDRKGTGYFYDGRSHLVRNSAKQLVEFMYDKTNWYDVLQWETKRIGTNVFYVPRIPGECPAKTHEDGGISYRVIDMSDILSWIEEAKSPSLEDTSDAISADLDELGDLVVQSQRTLDSAVAINRESDRVLENLAHILEEVENA